MIDWVVGLKNGRDLICDGVKNLQKTSDGLSLEFNDNDKAVFYEDAVAFIMKKERYNKVTGREV